MRDFCKRHKKQENCGCTDKTELTEREMRRGDTIVLPFQVVRNITTGQLFTVAQLGIQAPSFPSNCVPQDLTGFTIWMTLKKTVVEPDSQAIAQIDNALIGGITVTSFAQGQGTARINSSATSGFPNGDVELVYDIQVKDATGAVSTVEHGTYWVDPDVTLTTTPVIPTAPIVAPITFAAQSSQLVSNVAALIALKGYDGLRTFVLSLRSSWEYVSNGATLTIDHITVEATADGGNTRWVREETANPIWSSFAYIYIDGLNGNDENQGFYATAQATPAAIKTNAELFRRLGREWKVGTTPSIITLTFLNYPTDPFSLQINFAGAPNTRVNIIGAPRTLVRSGTFSAITARNPVTNTPFNVTDGIVVTTGDPSHRIRVTAGPRINTKAWIAKSTGAGQVRTSEWVQSDNLGNVTATAPQVGDAYVVESSPGTLLIDHIIIVGGSGNPFPNGPFVWFQDVDFAPVNLNSVGFIENGGCDLSFYGCFFTHGEWQVWTKQDAGDFISVGTYFIDCCVNGGGGTGIGNVHFRQGSEVENSVWAGLYFGQIAAVDGGGVTVDFDTLVQNLSSAANLVSSFGRLQIAAAGVMDTTATLVGGVLVLNGFAGLQPSFTNPPRLWGTSAVAGSFGVDVRGGGTFRYVAGSQITITGANGDFRMAGSTTAHAWDETANAGNGAYTGPIACTWANLIGGSLKDNAHNIPQDAHAYKNTGGAQP